MRAGSGQLLVLDTPVIVHLVRNKATGQAIEAQYSLTARRERPLLSTVVEGEILGLGRLWGWGEEKAQALRKLLANMVRVDAGLPEIVATYAALYCEATRSGRPRGENDLWIAATACATGAALVTCDADFAWLHPMHLTVYLVPETA
jgi:predicted nucleic acid-binding protein